MLTHYGRRLREPVGRPHGEGTETAPTSYGAMDGAVRSGERVCEEIRECRPEPYGPMPAGRAPGPEPTPSLSRRNVRVRSRAARVGVPSSSTRCSVSTEWACFG